jgi:hypothetical protein
MSENTPQTSKKNQTPIKLDPIEYFYLETPNVPSQYFPVNIYGIYDRITVTKEKLSRLKEDIIKILGESNKFGIYIIQEANTNSTKKTLKPSNHQTTIQ